jgi:hypothetical protein
MDNGQQRPHGVTGSSCAEAERDPMQLDLWSALQPQYDTFEAAAGEQPRAFISKAQPTRAREQIPEPKPRALLIDPLGAPQVAAAIDHGIAPPVRDEFPASTPPTAAAWFHPALIASALVAAVGVGWLGGASPSFFFAPAATPMQQADLPCARDSRKDSACAAKTDREPAPSAPPTIAAKTASPAAGANRAREPSRPTQQANAAASKDVTTTNSIAAGSSQERAKILPRPAPAPETRPTTIEGWTIREVVGGTAVLEGPGGVWRAAQGDTVPGIGRVESVVRWGNRWIVATSKGLISTQN